MPEACVPAIEVPPATGPVVFDPQVRRSWVPRPRLSGMVGGPAEGPEQPIVMISGPGGAGKSVLAGQVLAADGRAALELPLVPWLDEPAALTRAVVELLETVGPPAPNLHSSITASEPGFSTIVLPALDRLVRSRTTGYVLVIDDLHLLRDPSSQRVIRTTCEATPPGSRVILLSRDATPPWLSRARVEERLVEVTGRDLSFDTGEATDLLRRMSAPTADVDVAAIVEATRGWAVAVYLTGFALCHDQDPPTPFAASTTAPLSGRFMVDYVSTEILPPLEPDLQDFLIRSSILDELTAELCDAVLERTDSAVALTHLRDRLQLVVPTTTAGSRGRYHHLLGEALRVELSRHAPEDIPRLHARASWWYAQQGDLDAAIRHAKAGNDLTEVGRLAWSGTSACVGSGNTERLARWLSDLTDAQIAHDPWLSLSAAWLALQCGQNDRMDRWILHCERHAGPGWRTRASSEPYPACLALIVALVGRGGLADSQGLCEAAAVGIPPDEGFRAAALFIQGVALTLNRRAGEGMRCIEEAARVARVLEVPIIQADALSWRGVLAMADGDHRTGQQLIVSARDVILDHHLERLASAAHCFTAQALVQALRHDPEAPTTLSRARRLTATLGDIAPWFEVCGRLIQARAAAALGEAGLARQLILEATARMTPDLRATLAQDLLDDAEESLARVRADGVYTPALTAMEMRVLQFLPSHLQLPQIGEHLFVTQNTIKSHVRSIHRKLGVTSRAQAVERARELGLLESPAYD